MNDNHIIIRKQAFERVIFSFIIFILLALLAVQNFKCNSCSNPDDELLDDITGAAVTGDILNPPTDPVPDPIVEEPEATCEDNILNQDETNIDCGGVCGGYWYDGQCNEEPKPLSGEVVYAIDQIDYTITAEDFAVISKIEFSIDNGLESDLVLTALLYVFDETDDDVAKNYVNEKINLPKIRSGEVYKNIHDVHASFDDLHHTKTVRIVFQQDEEEFGSLAKELDII